MFILQIYNFFPNGAPLRKIMLGGEDNLTRFAVYLHKQTIADYGSANDKGA